jgi:hypothetical protein
MTSLNETWRKSTRSGPYTDNCVEVRKVNGTVEVRDTKYQAGPVPVLSFSEQEWVAFTAGVVDGEFQF